MKAWFQHIMLLRNNQQKVVTDGYPYLCEYGILGGSIKSLDMQMLFYPFKEQLNLPSFPIKFSDSQSIKSEVIGKESVDI